MTTFRELKRLVFLAIKRSDGEADIAVGEAINQAQRAIARVQDFDELIVLDTTHAATVVSQKSYHITSDLALVRPKDIYSIRYMDESNSRKLIWVDVRNFDQAIPYPEQTSTAKPLYYLRRGMYIDLHPIPDEAKSLYITHSQWPAVLEEDTDETPYVDMDDIIVALGSEIALAILEGGAMTGWTQRAISLLGAGLSEQRSRPDALMVARPFCPNIQVLSGDYWLNPWVKGD